MTLTPSERKTSSNADAPTDESAPNRIKATVPAGLNTIRDQIPGNVEVVSSFGYKTPPYAVTINGR